MKTANRAYALLTFQASNPKKSLRTVGIILILSLLQFIWLAWRIDTRVALVNLLPTVVLLSIWTLFVETFQTADRRWKALALLLPFMLALRLPLTVSITLAPLGPVLMLAMAAMVMKSAGRALEPGSLKPLLLALAMLLVSAGTHLGLDSPYTYTFRLMNGLASEYSGVDNNRTWECAYENPRYVVHCDARHFIASEKIFTEPDYDPSFSVVLQRFLFGYLNSLIGLEGHRWLASVGINVLFWFFTCLAVYRVGLITTGNRKIADVSMLCCASAWGFVDMVAQPAPYLLSYAWATIGLWATLELTAENVDRRRQALLMLVIASVVMVYDAYQLILAYTLLLILNRKYFATVAIFATQLLFAAFWRYISMRLVLGTEGDLASPASGKSNFALDFITWWRTITEFNVPVFTRFTATGIQAYLYGNLIIGAAAAWLYVALALAGKCGRHHSRQLLTSLLCINIAVLMAIVFVVPQMYFWSPATGMQPRLAFFSYPVNLVALSLLAVWWLGRYALLLPIALFLAANVDLTGLASLSVLFDYGVIGLFWK